MILTTKTSGSKCGKCLSDDIFPSLYSEVRKVISQEVENTIDLMVYDSLYDLFAGDLIPFLKDDLQRSAGHVR